MTTFRQQQHNQQQHWRRWKVAAPVHRGHVACVVSRPPSAGPAPGAAASSVGCCGAARPSDSAPPPPDAALSTHKHS